METREQLHQRVRHEQQLKACLRLATTRLIEAVQERIWAIVATHHAGLSIRQIAATTGLSRSCIHQLLGQKGFTKVGEKPDLLISIYYESDTAYYSNRDYKIQLLTLNIYNAEKGELIWRGTASPRIGSINTDASFGDLKGVVKDILSHFPPQ